ncbi:Aste57867_18453 [Aphanomyces stellatus]|uniref:Aste57867_18453 protein n=1 Tax=Aphanomyces stellatus TaxID=120398 RepID=A0A485LA53_9STRA|nr:hypothetical protein As57867_018391 [Aphanomyces stellatus]VFT95189.1 Aste57867_18453 [Aphanomyces stellatus]
MADRAEMPPVVAATAAPLPPSSSRASRLHSDMPVHDIRHIFYLLQSRRAVIAAKRRQVMAMHMTEERESSSSQPLGTKKRKMMDMTTDVHPWPVEQSPRKGMMPQAVEFSKLFTDNHVPPPMVV